MQYKILTIFLLVGCVSSQAVEYKPDVMPSVMPVMPKPSTRNIEQALERQKAFRASKKKLTNIVKKMKASEELTNKEQETLLKYLSKSLNIN